MSALDIQVGGGHYKKMPIQPMEFSMANNLDACQHTVVKYVTRFREKGGIQDLEKAKHVIDMLIEFEQRRLKEHQPVKQDPGRATPETDFSPTGGLKQHIDRVIADLSRQKREADSKSIETCDCPACTIERELKAVFGDKVEVVFVGEESGLTG